MSLTLDSELLALRNEYRQTHEERLKAKKKESELLNQLREICPHPNRYIAEVGFESGGILGSAKSPRRICEICGYSEEEWHSGYKELRNKKTYSASREQGNKLVFPLEDIE
jgi:hypothetical protein